MMDYHLWAYEYYTNRKGDSVTSQYTAAAPALAKGRTNHDLLC